MSLLKNDNKISTCESAFKFPVIKSSKNASTIIYANLPNQYKWGRYLSQTDFCELKSHGLHDDDYDYSILFRRLLFTTSEFSLVFYEVGSILNDS